MKNPNTNRSSRILLKQLAIAVAIGTGSAHALTTIEVGGAGTIGDTTLTTVAGVAQVPAIGSNWTVVGGTGTVAGVYSGLVSPAATVGNSGNVTLTFTHRYDFESDVDGIWDGGAVFVSVNGGPFTYVPTESFSSNGYVGDTLTSGSLAWPGGEKVFAGQSAGYTTPALITSVATLGSLSATDTVAVEFRGGWDLAQVNGPPAWEIGTVQISDTGGAILDVNFTTAGASGFTVANIGTVAGPWTYSPDSVSRFELDASTDTADRYKPDVAGSAINLNGVKIQVALLNGTLSTGDVFSLFDLTGGTTLTGSIGSISLPPGLWNTSQISAGGNGTITLVAFTPVDGTWAVNGIGNWSDSTKWELGTIAYGKDKTATFPDIFTASHVVTLDQPVTIGNLLFADTTNNPTLSGSDLTLDVTSGKPDIAATGAPLIITSAVVSNDGLSKSGIGNLTLTKMANTLTGDISIGGGIFKIGATTNDGISRQLGGGNFTGNIDIASGALFEFWTGTYSDQEFSGVISGGGGVKLAYRGTYTLSGANTYTGKTTIHGEYNGALAQLNVSSFNSVNGGTPPLASSSLGAPTDAVNGTVDIGRTNMQASALLNYTGPGETTDRVMNLVSGGASQIKGVNNLGTGPLTFTSPWTTSSGGWNTNALYIETDADITLNGNVPDNFQALEKRGNAKLSVSGPCTTFNNVDLYGGTLEVGSEINDGGVYAGAIATGSGNGGTNFITVPAGTPIAVGMTVVHRRLPLGTTIVAITDINANPVVVQVSSNSDSTNRTETGYIGFKGSLGIMIPAAASLRWLGDATLKYDGPNDSTNRSFTVNNDFTATWEIITGSTLTVSGATTNTTGKLTKTGDGTLVLSGALLHSGVNNVNAGSLLINGDSSGMTGAVTVASAATLGGSGTIGGATTVNGKLAPGASIGTLTFVMGGLTLGSLAADSLEFELGANTTAGTTYDTVVTSSLDIGTLDFADFKFTNTGTLAAGAYTLISSGAAITGSIGTAGGTIGAFTGTLSISGNNLILTVAGGSDPFATWAAAKGLDGTAGKENGKADDPDGDGKNNNYEFAFNGDPLDGSDNGMIAGLVQDASAPAGDELTLVVAVRDGVTFAGSGTPVVQSHLTPVDGLTYTIEGTLDLATIPGSDVSHVGGPSDTAPVATGLPDLTGTAWEYHTFKLDASEGLGSKGFLRAKVQ